MNWAVYKARGLGFIFWHGRHYGYHILLGLIWAWFLRELWGQFSWRWVSLSVAGSLLPDVDHLIYHASHGREDSYTRQVVAHIKDRRWRELTLFLKNGHKHNTNLMYHNIYTTAFLLIMSGVSTIFDWEAGVILFGAMAIHFLFDIADDILVLGYVNPNWKRWGSGKKGRGPLHFF